VFQDVRFLTTCKDFFANGAENIALKWQKSPFAALKSSAFRDKNTTFCVDEPAKHTSNAVNSQVPLSSAWYRDLETGQAYTGKFPELREDTFAEVHLYTPGGTQRTAILQFNLSPELYIKLEDEADAVLSKRKIDTFKWSMTNTKKAKKSFAE